MKPLQILCVQGKQGRNLWLFVCVAGAAWLAVWAYGRPLNAHADLEQGGHVHSEPKQDIITTGKHKYEDAEDQQVMEKRLP